MKIHDLSIIEDEGTRVLLTGTADDGRHVSFHVSLTSDRGIELVRRLHEDPDSVQIELPAPEGADSSWSDRP